MQCHRIRAYEATQACYISTVVMDPTKTPVSTSPRIRWQSLGGYVYASLVAAVLLVTADLLSGPAPLNGWTIIVAAGIGCGFGWVAGIFIRLVFFLVSYTPVVLSHVLWPVTGIGFGLAVAIRLGAFTRWGTHHHRLAVFALLGAVVGGLIMGVVMMAMQPTRQSPRGTIVTRGRWMRGGLLGCLIALALALVLADRFAWVGLYGHTHAVMRVGAFTSLLFALFLAVPDDTKLRSKLWRGFISTAVVLPIWSLCYLHYDRSFMVYDLTERPFSRAALAALRTLTDVDGDGFSSLFGGGDCRPFDSSVHPNATEIPANGIDDNCGLGDAPEKGRALTVLPAPQTPSPVSIVLITIEALRPDHMSTYGYERATTPKLKAWSKGARRYDNAYAAGASTSVVFPSIMRGVWPRRFKWEWLYETTQFRLLRPPVEKQLLPNESIRKRFPVAYNDARPPLAWWLQRRGMTTVAVVDDGYGEFLSPGNGIERGFDRFKEVGRLRPHSRNDNGTSNLAIGELRRIRDGERFFLWAHYYGPHDPNHVHEGFPKFGHSVPDLYDHEIAYADHHVGRLLRRIGERADSPNILVFVTSDHGEVLFPLARYHGADLSEANIHIPLLVKGPGVAPGEDSRLVSHVDLMPTIMARTQTPGPASVDGVDIFNAPEHRMLLADSWSYDSRGEASHNFVAAFDGKHKVLYQRLRNAYGSLKQNDERLSDQQGQQDKALEVLRSKIGRYVEGLPVPP